MAKEELIQFEGLVTEILPDARYRVQLDAGHEIVAYTAGKMKKNRIKTLAGDRVTIEMSPYDLEKGRLIFRHKDERPGTAARRVVHRRAASSAADKRQSPGSDQIRTRAPFFVLTHFPRANRCPPRIKSGQALARKRAAKPLMAKSCRCVGSSLQVANPARTKNRARQDCFEGYFGII